MPASLAYEALRAELGEEVNAVAKELEVYAGPEPPAGYTLEVELDGIGRCGDEAGFERFHLLGYSAGGAASLAFTAAHPDRVLSLALLEPAWAGNEGLGPGETAVWSDIRGLVELPPDQMMPAFVAGQIRPGVEPPAPPPGPPPPWMALRPAGLTAVIAAFTAAELDLGSLLRFEGPVYFALGGLSNPDYFAETAKRLSGVFADFTLEVFEERHHFDPPHRTEPGRLAASLREIWERAESQAAAG